MFGRRIVNINERSALLMILSFVLLQIQITNSANGHKSFTKSDDIKSNVKSDTDFQIPQQKKNDVSACPNDTTVECETLNHPCIDCKYNSSCIYGKPLNVSCDVDPMLQCSGEKKFNRTMICRYCFQTDIWEYQCEHRGNCNSLKEPHYKTNCTMNANVLCLGNRAFSKFVPCNWTHGYRWSTALLISITLGGFGADRFYLGHWQEGIGKLFSFGGLGVWTIIDVLLISLHYLGPADGSLYI